MKKINIKWPFSFSSKKKENNKQSKPEDIDDEKEKKNNLLIYLSYTMLLASIIFILLYYPGSFIDSVYWMFVENIRYSGLGIALLIFVIEIVIFYVDSLSTTDTEEYKSNFDKAISAGLNNGKQKKKFSNIGNRTYNTVIIAAIFFISSLIAWVYDLYQWGKLYPYDLCFWTLSFLIVVALILRIFAVNVKKKWISFSFFFLVVILLLGIWFYKPVFQTIPPLVTQQKEGKKSDTTPKKENTPFRFSDLPKKEQERITDSIIATITHQISAPPVVIDTTVLTEVRKKIVALEKENAALKKKVSEGKEKIWQYKPPKIIKKLDSKKTYNAGLLDKNKTYQVIKDTIIATYDFGCGCIH